VLQQGRLAHARVAAHHQNAALTGSDGTDQPFELRRNNDFTYAADPHGRQVPLGSHMRRMYPRDTEMAQLADVNVHRIIRRSTTYGAPYDPDAVSDEADETARGLYFLFLSAKAMATMEFLQQEWINNGNFMNLGAEHDPNVGLQDDGATFTIPRAPVRTRSRLVPTSARILAEELRHRARHRVAARTVTRAAVGTCARRPVTRGGGPRSTAVRTGKAGRGTRRRAAR
jgi:deferrochelatase/peroxidase EfeB